MEPIAAGLSDDEIAAVADYYAARIAGGQAVSTLPAEAALGKAIANGGLPDRQVPACAKCHGPGAQRRNPHYPRLAGQYPEYLALQLSLFKSDRRGGTSYHGIMRKVAVWLSDEELRAVATYYGSLTPGSDQLQH
jgi:cytochrome c553